MMTRFTTALVALMASLGALALLVFVVLLTARAPTPGPHRHD